MHHNNSHLTTDQNNLLILWILLHHIINRNGAELPQDIPLKAFKVIERDVKSPSGQLSLYILAESTKF
jgi:hypothetical protein